QTFPLGAEQLAARGGVPNLKPGVKPPGGLDGDELFPIGAELDLFHVRLRKALQSAAPQPPTCCAVTCFERAAPARQAARPVVWCEEPAGYGGSAAEAVPLLARGHVPDLHRPVQEFALVPIRSPGDEGLPISRKRGPDPGRLDWYYLSNIAGLSEIAEE